MCFSARGHFCVCVHKVCVFQMSIFATAYRLNTTHAHHHYYTAIISSVDIFRTPCRSSSSPAVTPAACVPMISSSSLG